MESCPHCHFLMRDDAVECGVCHRPRVVVATEGYAVVDDSRVVEHPTTMPVVLVVLTGLLVAAGGAILAVAQHWW